jgi:hypothetical protein
MLHSLVTEKASSNKLISNHLSWYKRVTDTLYVNLHINRKKDVNKEIRKINENREERNNVHRNRNTNRVKSILK